MEGLEGITWESNFKAFSLLKKLLLQVLKKSYFLKYFLNSIIIKLFKNKFLSIGFTKKGKNVLKTLQIMKHKIYLKCNILRTKLFL